MTREYLPGTCYLCQKCLICFSSESCESCECDKSAKPVRVSNPGCGKRIYSRVFNPNSEELKAANQLLFFANEKYQYNSNFNEAFLVTLCSAFHSRFQRKKTSDKLTKTKDRFTAKKKDSPIVKKEFNNNKSTKTSTPNKPKLLRILLPRVKIIFVPTQFTKSSVDFFTA